MVGRRLKGTTESRAQLGALKAARDNLKRIHELEAQGAAKRKASQVAKWLEDGLIGTKLSGTQVDAVMDETVLRAMVTSAEKASTEKFDTVDKDNAFLRARIANDTLKIKRLEARIRARDNKIKVLKERVEELSDMNGIMEA